MRGIVNKVDRLEMMMVSNSNRKSSDDSVCGFVNIKSYENFSFDANTSDWHLLKYASEVEMWKS